MRKFAGVAVILAAVAGCGGTSPGALSPSDLASPESGGPGDAGDAAVADDVPLLDGQACRPGSAQCMGSVLLMCNAAGSDWISAPCPAGTTCTVSGCIGSEDSGPRPQDVPVTDDVPPVEDVPAPTDNPSPVDPGPGPVDVPVVQDPGPPPADVPPQPCGQQVCNAQQECCQTPMGRRCFPIGECPGQPPQSCQTDQDCDGGDRCCPPPFPGGQNRCQPECQGGGGNLPTCQGDGDCTGGQTCVDLYLSNLCLSTCASDADCGGQVCREIGAIGFVLANVCECGTDTDCADPLVCCEIPYLGQSTCMTACPSL